MVKALALADGIGQGAGSGDCSHFAKLTSPSLRYTTSTMSSPLKPLVNAGPLSWRLQSKKSASTTRAAQRLGIRKPIGAPKIRSFAVRRVCKHAILDAALQKGTAEEGLPMSCCISNCCLAKLLRAGPATPTHSTSSDSSDKVEANGLDFADAVALTRSAIHKDGQVRSRQLLKERILRSQRPGEERDCPVTQGYSYDGGETTSRGKQQWWWFTESGSSIQVRPFASKEFSLACIRSSDHIAQSRR